MTTVHIESGTGNGFGARVTNTNKLSVLAETLSIQCFASLANASAYQAHSDLITVASPGTRNVLSMRNDNTDKTFIVTYIRCGCDETETQSARVDVKLKGTWVAGTALTSIYNMNTASVLTPGATLQTNQVLAGADNIDYRYISGPGEATWSKEGSIVIPPGGIIGLDITTQTAGVIVYGRVSFLVLDNETVANLT